MKTDWPPELVLAIASRRCVLFFGAGVSMNAVGKDGKTRTPTWSTFLDDMTNSVGNPRSAVRMGIRKLIKERDFLTAAEVIRNEIGPERFINYLKDRFHTPDFQPARIHDLLFQLDLRIALTPNVDGIYESAVTKRGSGAVTVKDYHDDDVADSLRRHERVLIKTHGSISTPSKIVFTRSDYAEARNKHAGFYELIDALLRTHTFMFVGCGLDDPDIRALLENYRYRHPSTQSHYFVTASGGVTPQVRRVIQESMRIRIVEYQKSADHGHLTTALEDLVAQVEAKRADIAATQKW